MLILAGILISIQKYFSGVNHFWNGDYTHYNNYVIFKNSFKHLLENKILYEHYKNEYADLYKYSPACALFMGLFYYLPDWLGLIIWNCINILCIYFGIINLNIKKRSKIFIIFFILIELITSTQNSQSNAMICGLILLSFSNLEKNNYWIASLCIVSCFYIKVFGIVAAALYLLFPQKNKLILFTLFWLVLFAVAPLILITPHDLGEQYKAWLVLLENDNTTFYGISIYGFINSISGKEISKNLILIPGVSIFLLPLTRKRLHGIYFFRLLFLCSILIWIVIFNHKAESPTYIIALTGCGIWYSISEKRLFEILLIIFAFILISLSPTDLFPKFIRQEYVIPYSLKALPAILIWLNIFYILCFTNSKFRNSIN